MATANFAVSMETLTKSNYDTWCVQAEALLIRKDLWDYVIGEKTLPPKADEAAKLKFEKNDQRARAEIILMLPPSELKKIKDCITSEEVWAELEHLHGGTEKRKTKLLKELVLKKMGTNDDVRVHLHMFMENVGELDDMGIKLPKELLSVLMVSSLPSSRFRENMEDRDLLPSLEDLKSEIINSHPRHMIPGKGSTKTQLEERHLL